MLKFTYMSKKISLSLFPLLISTFLAIFLLAAPTFAQTYTHTNNSTIGSYQTVFRAQIINQRVPPTAPILQNPLDNPSNFCDRQPIFSWAETISVTGPYTYTFNLSGRLENSQVYNFSQNLNQNLDTADFRAWQENGIWYLQLKNSLEFGQYNWSVTVTDPNNLSASSSTYSFVLDSEICTYDCERDSIFTSVNFTAPNGIINSLRPAIVFTYPENTSPKSMEVIVDEIGLIKNIDLSKTHTTPEYTLTLDQPLRQITLQMHQDYLPPKNPDQATWDIKLLLTDHSNCNLLSPINQLQASSSLTCTSNALNPLLISPSSDFLTPDNQKITNFSWSLCARESDLVSQIFTLNGQDYDLNPNNPDTSAFSWTKSYESSGDLCLGPQLNYQLTLTDPTLVTLNDPLDSNDWNRWSISTTACNNLSATSLTYRFRTFPESGGDYHWCSDDTTCTSGTLAECAASGKNCYFQDQPLCLTQAALDCSTDPTQPTPGKAYFWCQDQSQCVAGTLTECIATGKNCFIEQDNQSGTGCLQNAATDCSNQAQYFWCDPTQYGCQLGDFSSCVASGQPCYRQTNPSQTCPTFVLESCTPAAIDQADGPSDDLINALTQGLDVPFNGLDALGFLGFSDETLRQIEILSVTVFPIVSTAIFLPLALIVLFFPRPKGRVYDFVNKKGLSGALVVVQKDNQFIKSQITNRHGHFNGFKLFKGQYYLLVTHPDYLYPCPEPRPEHSKVKNFYLQDKFRLGSDFASSITYQIPLSRQTATQENTNQTAQQKNQRSLFASLVNFIYKVLNLFSFIWSITFILVILLTLLYPTLLNLIILSIYIFGFLLRLLANLHRVNFSGRVYTKSGEPAKNFTLAIHLLAHHSLAAITTTNDRGYFEFFLDPKQIYLGSSSGFGFSEENGWQETFLIDYQQNKKINLVLVVQETHQE